jgi:hypothetical protein
MGEPNGNFSRNAPATRLDFEVCDRALCSTFESRSFLVELYTLIWLRKPYEAMLFFELDIERVLSSDTMTYSMPHALVRALLLLETNIEATDLPARDAEGEEADACGYHSLHRIHLTSKGK